MKYELRKYWTKVRTLLVGKKSHEVLLFVFFLCVSAGFWLLQTLNETFEVEIQVPLRLRGVPDNVLVTTELPAELSVMVRDRGSSIIRYYRENELAPVEVDFSKYDNGAINGRVQLSGSEILHSVQNLLEGTTQVLSIRPDTLEYYYNRGLSRRLAVRACGSLSASPQNYVQEVRFSPDSVTVYAPSSVLDTMKYAYTRPLTMTNLSSNETSAVRLRSMKGVKYDPDAVEMSVSIGYYAEKTVKVPVIGLNFPGDKVLRTFPSRVDVTFRVESAKYQNITSENFVLAATYEELLQNASDKYRLHLKSMPEGVSNVRISPTEVDYLIEQIETEETKQ